MLVVRRVDVDEIDVELGRENVGVEPGHAARGAGNRLGKPERELVVGARRPGLEVRHLQAGRAVDTVGGLEQRGQDDAPLDLRQRVSVDRVTDRVDAGSVLGLEEPRPAAERLGEVPLPALERRELGEDCGDSFAIERLVGDDVGLAEHLRVGGEIVGMDGDPEAAQRLPDARRAGEEVARRRDRKAPGYALDEWHERALRPQVLDHSCSSNAALRQWPQTRPLD